MDSQQFLDWLEQKLQGAGVQKVIPDTETLAVAYRHLVRVARLQDELEAAMDALPEDTDIAVPDDLQAVLRDKITNTTSSWDDVLWRLVRTQAAN
jgi:hypothetical protein